MERNGETNNGILSFLSLIALHQLLHLWPARIIHFLNLLRIASHEGGEQELQSPRLRSWHEQTITNRHEHALYIALLDEKLQQHGEVIGVRAWESHVIQQ